MGIIRFLMRYLMNNEQLINKLAESKPIRHGARMLVYILTRAGMISSTHRLKSPKEAIQILKNIATNFKNEIKQVKDEFKKK